LANLAWHLAVRRPHLLYTLTVVPNIWGRLFGALARVPVIVASWRSLFPKQHERWLWRLSSRVICNARVLKGIMVERHGVDPSRIAVIENPVDAQVFSPDPGSKAAEPTVVSIGRLVREKDPLTLVEGFRLAAVAAPEARFEIIGDGYMKRDVSDLIRKHSLERSVSLLPARSDIRPDLRRAWVFVLASVREASPNVILEAMATQLPIVASAVGGIPELVRDGENGFLFEPRDPTGLAAHVGKLLTNAELRQRMGENGRRQVLTHHTMDRMVRETERVFLEAAEEAAAQGRLRPRA
jgi:glycosyltransferase involved in cell wall biosynthesis